MSTSFNVTVVYGFQPPVGYVPPQRLLSFDEEIGGGSGVVGGVIAKIIDVTRARRSEGGGVVARNWQSGSGRPSSNTSRRTRSTRSRQRSSTPLWVTTATRCRRSTGR